MGDPNINGNNFWSRMQFTWNANDFMQNCTSWANTWLTGNVWSQNNWFGGNNFDFLNPLNFAQSFMKFGGGLNFGGSIFPSVGGYTGFTVGDTFNGGFGGFSGVGSGLRYTPASTGDDKTPADMKFERSFNLMLKHLTRIKDSIGDDGQFDDIVGDIKNVISKCSTRNKENFAKLKGVYEKDEVQKYIKDHRSIVFGNDTLGNRLLEAGYSKNTEAAESIGKLVDNPTVETTLTFSLGAISAYQKSNGSLIKNIRQKINSADTSKKDAYKALAIDFAQQLLNSIDSDYRNSNMDLALAYDGLNNIISNNSNFNWNDFEKAFNKLYTSARIAKTQKAVELARGDYGDNFSAFPFLNDIEATTKAELKEEGMEQEDIDNAANEDNNQTSGHLAALAANGTVSTLGEAQQTALKEFLGNNAGKYDLTTAVLGKHGDDKDVVFAYNKENKQIEKLNIKYESSEFKYVNDGSEFNPTQVIARDIAQQAESAAITEQIKKINGIVTVLDNDKIQQYKSSAYSKAKDKTNHDELASYTTKMLDLSYTIRNGIIQPENQDVYNDLKKNTYNAIKENISEETFDILFQVAWIQACKEVNMNMPQSDGILRFFDKVFNNFKSLVRKEDPLEYMDMYSKPLEYTSLNINEDLGDKKSLGELRNKKANKIEINTDTGEITVPMKDGNDKNIVEHTLKLLREHIKQNYSTLDNNKIDSFFKDAIALTNKKIISSGCELEWFITDIMKNFDQLLYAELS